MVRENQILVQQDENRFVCISCNNRSFSSQENLFEHCRTAKVHQGQWCDAHEWLFVDDGALSAHLRDAFDHWACPRCEADEDTEEELVEHLGLKHSRCYHCDQNVGNFHRHRVEEHNRCDECSKEFDDQNEVAMHQQIHQPRNEKCFWCPRKFKSYAGILIHLESNTCESGVTKSNIDDWAEACYQHKQFMNNADAEHRYFCPTCELDMPRVSSLFQHIETNACAASYVDRALEALVRFLQKQTSACRCATCMAGCKSQSVVEGSELAPANCLPIFPIKMYSTRSVLKWPTNANG